MLPVGHQLAVHFPQRLPAVQVRLEEEQGAAVRAAAERLAGVLDAWRARVAV